MKFRDITPFGVRFPTELKNKLKAAAAAKTGSINAEVVARIAASFEPPRALNEVSDGELIQELINRYGRDGIFIRIGKDGHE